MSQEEEEQSINQKFIYFGDYIILRVQQYNKAKQQNIDGFLNSLGHNDKNIYFQQLPSDLLSNEENFEKNEEEAKQESNMELQNEQKAIKMSNMIRNYRDFVFQIWPKCNNEAHKDFRKKKKEIEILEQTEKENGVNDQQEIMKQNFLNKIVELEKRKQLESTNNYKLREHFKQLNVVTYGSEIQFMHVDSGMFLQGRVTASETETTAFQFTLSDNFSQGMIFKILPKFKLRQIGEIIQYGDNLNIKNDKTKSVINFQIDIPAIIDKPLVMSEKQEQYPVPNYRTNDKRTFRYPTYLSQFSDISWQIKKYGEFSRSEEQSKKIKGGDVIRLRHTEFEGFLSADIPYESQFPEVYLRYYTKENEYKHEQCSISSLWEVEILQFDNRGGYCPLQIDDKKEITQFRLRHFQTGRLLSMASVNFRNQKKQKLIPILAQLPDDPNAQDDPNSFVSFISTKKGKNKYLINGRCYNLLINKQYTQKMEFKHKEENYKNFYSYHDQSDMKKDYFFQRINDNDLYLKRHPIEVCEGDKKKEEDAYWIQTVDKEFFENVCFIRSTIPTILRLVNIFKTCPIEKINQELSDDFLATCLRQLKNLIFFVIKTQSTDPFTCEGISIEFKQMLMRDMKYIELLTDLLYYPFHRKYLDLTNMKDIRSDLFKIFQISYRLILFSIREYRPNEMYASQWIGFMMHQTINCDPNKDIKAEPTLTELIDNNQYVLENKINSDIVRYFIELLIKHKDIKYLKILKAFVNCGGKAISKNQEQISKLIFQNFDQDFKNVQNSLIYPLRMDDTTDTIEIKITDKWEILSDLKNLQDTVPEYKSLKAYDYYINTLHFISDLCLERNFIAIHQIIQSFDQQEKKFDLQEKKQTLFPMEICYQIITNPKYDYELRSVFAKLFLNSWIDGQQLEKLDFPNNLRIWENIPDQINYEITFNQNIKVIEIFRNVKNFIVEFMTEQTKNPFQNLEQQELNSFTTNILEIALYFITYGFYQSMEELKELLIPILIYLNASMDVNNEDQEKDRAVQLAQIEFNKKNDFPIPINVKEKNPIETVKEIQDNENNTVTSKYVQSENNQILLNNRKLCTEILIKANEIRLNNRANNFLINFKQDQIKQKKQEEMLHNNHPIDQSKEKQEEMQNRIVDKPLQWIQEITESGDLDFYDLSLLDINSVLVELFMYDNIELQQNSFKLILMHFTQKYRLVEYMKDIQILDDKDKILILNESKRIRKKLSGLSEKAEQWYGLNDTQSINEAELYLDLIDKLLNFMIGSQDRDIVNKTKEIYYVDEFITKQILKLDFQILFRNLQLYEPLIQIIQHDINTYKYGVETKLYKSILQRSYQLLSYFCFDDFENQNILQQHIKSFYYHLLNNPDTFAFMLIQEISRNNRTVLTYPNKLEENVRKIIESIDKLNNDDPLKPLYMDSLKVCMKLHNRVIKNNQTFIITTLGSNIYQNTLMLIHNSKLNLEEFTVKCEIFSQNFTKLLESKEINQAKNLDLPPFLEYFVSQLSIMSQTSEETNAASESKCQSSFSLDKILMLAQKAQECFPIRKILFYFCFHVYLETEKEIQDDMSQIKQIIFMCKDDLLQLSEKYEQISNDKILLKTYTGQINLVQFVDEYIQVLLQVVEIVIKKNIFYSDINEEKQVYFTDVLKSLQNLMNCTQNANSKNYIVQTMFMIEGRHYITSITDFQNKFQPQIPFEYKRLIKNFGLERKKRNFVTIASIAFPESMQKTLNKDKHSIGQEFNIRINQILTNQYFQREFVEKEFEMLIYFIKDIDKITKAAFFDMNTLNFDQVADRLISLVEPTIRTLDDESMKIGLKILRKIIELENMEQKTPSSDWNTEDYQEYQYKIRIKQNKMVELGCVNVVCQIIGSQYIDESIKHETILLGCSLLVGGNNNTQKKFYDYFQEDKQNDFFCQLRKMMESIFQDCKKGMDRRNKSKINMMDENTDQVQGEDMEKLAEHENAQLTNIKRIYRFLQLFCEGHFLTMQRFLHQQNQGGILNSKSVNFINLSCANLNVYLRFINSDSIDLGNQIIDFMIESIQGPCVENQKQMLNSKIVEIVSELLVMFNETTYKRRGFSDDAQKLLINGLISKSTKLFVTLLEGNSDALISKFLNSSLDFGKLSTKLASEFKSFLSDKLHLEWTHELKLEIIQEKMLSTIVRFEDNISEAFNMFLLFKNLASLLERYIPHKDNPNYENNAQECLDDQSNKLETAAKEFFQYNTGNIEIFFENKLHRIYFPIHPTCFNVSKMTRTKLMQTVKRDSPNDKIAGLIEEKQAMYAEMEHMSWLKSLPFQVTSKRLDQIRDLSTLQGFLINIILIWVLKRDVDKRESMQGSSLFLGIIDSSYLITILGLIQLILSITMLIFWLIIYGPIIKRVQWDRFVESNQNELIEELEEEFIDIPNPKTLNTKDSIYLLRTKGPYSDVFTVRGEMILGHFYTRLYFYEKTFIFYLSEPSLLYMAFYIVCSIIGFFVNPIIYSFHLLDIMDRFPMLKSVILSITTNANQLALTFFLGLIIMYIYTIIGYFFLNADFFNPDIPPAGENMCTSLFICYWWLIDYGLRNGGGISESLRVMSYQKENLGRYFVRFIYDISFFCLITVIFLNIIFGIIIDTFGGLRDEKNAMSEDMKQKCYICGLDRVFFDKDCGGFDNHIEKDHQLWNYLYYMYYLDRKDITEYDGIESYIISQNNNKDISWFPIMKAIAAGEEDESNIAEQIREKMRLFKEKLQNHKAKVHQLIESDAYQSFQQSQ